jgi:hypothetical protein
MEDVGIGILWPFGIFYGLLVYLLVILIYFPFLVFCTNKNLATLIEARLEKR